MARLRTFEETQMHARKHVRDVLIAQKMLHWVAVAKLPLIDSRCPAWRARKNYWHLWRRYPEIAARLGLSEMSVFRPL
jgi:hypothetical protein